MTITVGIREAKVHLSRIMKKVQQGAEIIVTDRGKPVGKIVPFHRQGLSLTQRIAELELRGIIEENRMVRRPLPPPLPADGETAQRFLEEDRR